MNSKAYEEYKEAAKKSDLAWDKYQECLEESRDLAEEIANLYVKQRSRTYPNMLGLNELADRYEARVAITQERWEKWMDASEAAQEAYHRSEEEGA